MKITIAGGDLRMLTVGSLLSELGYACDGFGFGERIKDFPSITPSSPLEALENASAVILPLPCEKDGFLNTPFSSSRILLEDIFSSADEDTLFIGGRLSKSGERYIDYSEREDFKIKNAVPTAEGAVALAMKELDTTLYGSNAVVVGYGRIGKYLSAILRDLGASVTVLARSLESRAYAESNRIRAVGFDKIQAPLSESDVVFNTVPTIVIGERELALMKPGSLLIDLASLPGGVDENAARNYGMNFLRALSLPGKVAPTTAGRIVFETVRSILLEKGVTV